MVAIALVCLLCVLVITGFLRLNVASSRLHMINADWLTAADKFKFVARWGA